MSAFSCSVGAMLIAASVMMKGPRIERRLHHEAVAHAPAGAQPAGDHCAHQLVGVQAALHQRLDRTGQCELDGAGRGGMAVRRVLDHDAAEVQAVLGRDLEQALARADQQRFDQAGSTRVERRRQADRVARVARRPP
jgi:hypothetical protein